MTNQRSTKKTILLTSGIWLIILILTNLYIDEHTTKIVYNQTLKCLPDQTCPFNDVEKSGEFSKKLTSSYLWDWIKFGD